MRLLPQTLESSQFRPLKMAVMSKRQASSSSAGKASGKEQQEWGAGREEHKAKTKHRVQLIEAAAAEYA